jgi:myo-inositol-1(or 4)-monophosphatase
MDHKELKNFIEENGRYLLTRWPGQVEAHNADRKAREDALCIKMKEDGTRVTRFDIEMHNAITNFLAVNYSDYGIISEEAIPADDVYAKEKIWILDPIDGTSAFIEGRDDFSILAGLIEKGEVDYGIMCFPVYKITAFAGKGTGAFIDEKQLNVSNNHKVGEKRLHCSKCEIKKNDNPTKEKDALQKLIFPGVLDSGNALLKVASGELDAVIIKIVTHKEWDLAAPSRIIIEAGGVISDEQGSEIHFGEREIYYSYFVATNKKVHTEILSYLNEKLIA